MSGSPLLSRDGAAVGVFAHLVVVTSSGTQKAARKHASKTNCRNGSL